MKTALFLRTAGGAIQCLRCTARSKRTDTQCGRPALKVSKNQKCQFHGGLGNSGAQTPEGKARSIAAHTKTGYFSQAARDERARKSARLLQLEDSMHVLGMITGTRTRGRKPSSYVPVKDLTEVAKMIFDMELHPAESSDAD